MRPAQENYIRQCGKEFKASLGACPRCDPDPKPVHKRWEDTLHSLAEYVDAIAVPKGFPKVKVEARLSDPMVWGPTWGAGVFEGDSYDSGVQKWYWRIALIPPKRIDEVVRIRLKGPWVRIDPSAMLEEPTREEVRKIRENGPTLEEVPF